MNYFSLSIYLAMLCECLEIDLNSDNYTISQPVSQSVSQSVSRSVNQSVSQSVN